MGLFIKFGIMSQGGKLGRLFVSKNDTVAELNLKSFAVINQATKANYNRLGGAKNKLYKLQSATNDVYEVNLDTFATLNSNLNTTPITDADDVGGIDNRLFVTWNGNSGENKGVNELNPETLAIIVSHPRAYAEFYMNGIGGVKNRLYGTNTSTHFRYEINPDTIAVLNTVAGDAYASGVDGINEKLYRTHGTLAQLRELNLDTLAEIRTITAPFICSGVGGVKQ
jgi:hypothetical protein